LAGARELIESAGAGKGLADGTWAAGSKPASVFDSTPGGADINRNVAAGRPADGVDDAGGGSWAAGLAAPTVAASPRLKMIALFPVIAVRSKGTILFDSGLIRRPRVRQAP